MFSENEFSDFINEVSLLTKIENILINTCGTWQNCNNENILSFLSQCNDYNIDPQYCMSWIEQHKEEIPNWESVSDASLAWMNQNTSTGSPYSPADEGLS